MPLYILAFSKDRVKRFASSNLFSNLDFLLRLYAGGHLHFFLCQKETKQRKGQSAQASAMAIIAQRAATLGQTGPPLFGQWWGLRQWFASQVSVLNLFSNLDNFLRLSAGGHGTLLAPKYPKRFAFPARQLLAGGLDTENGKSTSLVKRRAGQARLSSARKAICHFRLPVAWEKRAK